MQLEAGCEGEKIEDKYWGERDQETKQYEARLEEPSSFFLKPLFELIFLTIMYNGDFYVTNRLRHSYNT